MINAPQILILLVEVKELETEEEATEEVVEAEVVAEVEVVKIGSFSHIIKLEILPTISLKHDKMVMANFPPMPKSLRLDNNQKTNVESHRPLIQTMLEQVLENWLKMTKPYHKEVVVAIVEEAKEELKPEVKEVVEAEGKEVEEVEEKEVEEDPTLLMTKISLKFANRKEKPIKSIKLVKDSDKITDIKKKAPKIK